MLNQKSINLGVRYILEWDKLNLAIWLWVSISFFIHYLSEKDNKNYYSGLIYKDFGIFADSFFAAITYGLAATTSTAILKGVYIQQMRVHMKLCRYVLFFLNQMKMLLKQ